MKYENIKEIKLIRKSASKTDDFQESINKLLNEGWVLLNINFMNPSELPGEYYKTNYNIATLGLPKNKGMI